MLTIIFIPVDLMMLENRWEMGSHSKKKEYPDVCLQGL